MGYAKDPPDEDLGVTVAKRAYVRGEIDLPTLERALEDRIGGGPYSHDPRIDGAIPGGSNNPIY